MGKGAAQEHGAGLIKIAQKHKIEMAQITETIAKGRIVPLAAKGTNTLDPDGLAIIHGTNIAILSRKDKNAWRSITHYKSAKDAQKIEATSKSLEVAK